MRYFNLIGTKRTRCIGESTPSVLNECLTASKQVGTKLVDGQEIPVYEFLWKELTKEEYDSMQPKEPEPQKPTYEQLVIAKIRTKYSVDEELAILRQRDTKPEEFAEYNEFCELCKIKVKSQFN